jgi:hypothetical protein
MAAQSAHAYPVVDTLYLWWTGDPARPVLIGELGMVRAQRGVSLRYAESWRKAGFPLSEDLPLVDTNFLPASKETAVGAVDDARPDRWGERVIRFLDKPPRLSLMEYLYFAGDERFGALGVSTSSDEYLARRLGPLPELADVAQIDELVKKLAAGEPVPAEQRRLVAPGVTMGGARPKALLALGGEQWVLKFSEPDDVVDMPLIEHAALTLAERAQIRVATTRPVALARGHAVAVKRFDRFLVGQGYRRRHALSANVALKAAGEGLGYPELAQLLRRRGVAGASVGRAQMAELCACSSTRTSTSAASSAAFDKVKAAIEAGDFRSADVKKLQRGPYYRAKLDYANRLLLQFARIDRPREGGERRHRDRVPGAGGDREPRLRQARASCAARWWTKPRSSASRPPTPRASADRRRHAAALAGPGPHAVRAAGQAHRLRRGAGRGLPPARAAGRHRLGRLGQDRGHAGQAARGRGPGAVRHPVGLPGAERPRAARRARLREPEAGGRLPQLPRAAGDAARAARPRGDAAMPSAAGASATARRCGCWATWTRRRCSRSSAASSARSRRAAVAGRLPGAGHAPEPAEPPAQRELAHGLFQRYRAWLARPICTTATWSRTPGAPRSPLKQGRPVLRLRRHRRGAGPHAGAAGPGAGAAEGAGPVHPVRRQPPDRAPQLLQLGGAEEPVLAGPGRRCGERREPAAAGAAGQLPQHARGHRAGQPAAEDQAGALRLGGPREQLPRAQHLGRGRRGGLLVRRTRRLAQLDAATRQSARTP